MLYNYNMLYMLCISSSGSLHKYSRGALAGILHNSAFANYTLRVPGV